MEQPPHDCPGGCGAQVPFTRFACPADWARLPHRLRRAITSNYRRRPVAHARAMTAARTWFATQNAADTSDDPSGAAR